MFNALSGWVTMSLMLREKAKAQRILILFGEIDHYYPQPL